VVAVVVSCGCNGILGLGSTVAIDGRLFDTPIDSPYSCPATGTTPHFSPTVHRDIAQNCVEYTISTTTGRAAAACSDPGQPPYIGDGAIDGSLAPASGIASITSPDSIAGVWLVPEGDVVIVAGLVAGTARFRRFQRAADGSWSSITDLNISANSGFTMSGLTRGPAPHLVRYDINAEFEELGDDGSNMWATHVATFTRSTLGVGTVLTYPHLSGDGLRLLFIASPIGSSQQHVFYTDRARLGDPFRPADRLDELPVAIDTFLTDDCSRVYFTTGNEIGYAQRL
jgi:hypothetical protein